MILIWGHRGDTPTTRVHDALTAAGAQLAFLDQHEILETAITVAVDGHVNGVLKLSREELALERIRAVYVRPYDIRRAPAIARAGPDSQQWAHAQFVEAMVASWTELTDALVVNRLPAMGSNNSKPYQSQLIQAAGFAVPETLITTDPAAVAAFWRKHRSVIYKSVSGVRSIVSRLGPYDLEHLDDVMTCPTQFQQYIDGTDFRVHVVGEEVFGCEVQSAADDYRYAAKAGEPDACLCAYEVPEELAKRCREMTAELGLSVAGIDLRRTADGGWVCFEVNPSPAFTYYEAATGHPIGRAIAELLMSR